MIVKINLDTMNIETEKNSIYCKTEKEFKDNVARIIKGKSEKKEVPTEICIGQFKTIPSTAVRTVYTPFNNIDEIQFISDLILYKDVVKFFNNKTTYPTVNTISYDCYKLLGMAVASKQYCTLNGKKLDGATLDAINEVYEQRKEDKINYCDNFHIVERVYGANDKELKKLYDECLIEKSEFNKPSERFYLDIEQFCFKLQAFINQSGYDVAMDTETVVEGKLIYNFYDGAQQVQGCKSTTTKYAKYASLAKDLIDMFINVQYYKSIGLEPELTHQRHTNIGLANSFRFNDDDELEAFIEKEMNSNGFSDVYDKETYVYNASVDMLLN